MEVGRDPPALQLGGIQCPPQELLAAGVLPAKASGKRPREGNKKRGDRDQRPDERRREAFEQVRAAGGYRAVALVGLEQELAAVGSLDGEIHLEQVAMTTVEAVLGEREIAQFGVHLAGAERRELLGAEPVAGVDQARVVRVDDPAASCPDLHSHHIVAQHALPHDPIDVAARHRVVPSR